MDVLALLPDPEQLAVNQVNLGTKSLRIEVRSTAQSSCCPSCGRTATRIHSRYERTVKDLSCCGRRVCLRLTVRRFYCDGACCARQIFCERIGAIVAPYQRMTQRLAQQCRSIGLEVGAESAQRVLHLVAEPVGADVVLNEMKRESEPPVAVQVRHLGIDDWAWRKGQTYGTILVDLDARRVIDLLLDRDVSTVKAWLIDHPEIELVTRDRSSGYQEAVTLGAPQAEQVADHWHLLKNLRETLERFLIRIYPQVKAVFEKAFQPSEPILPDVIADDCASPLDVKPASDERHEPTERTRHRFEQVKACQKQGLSAHRIARKLGISPVTARKYLQLNQCLGQRKRCSLPSIILPHVTWIKAQWQAGNQNAAELFRQLRQIGYQGGYTVVREFCATLIRRERPHDASPCPTAVSLSWMMLFPESVQKPVLVKGLEACRSELPALRQAEELSRSAWVLLSGKGTEPLREWCCRANGSQIPEFIRFVTGIERDYNAVLNATNSTWSNGQTEGQVNRLKTLKRAMYGRASLPLLKARLFHRATR